MTGIAGSLVIDHGNAGGGSSIVFPSRNNRSGGIDFGYIRYRDDVNNGTNGTATEQSRLEIGVENDYGAAGGNINDCLILNKNGGTVGIGTSNPIYTLDVTGSGRFTQTLISSGLITGNGGITVPSGQTIAANGGISIDGINLITGNSNFAYGQGGLSSTAGYGNTAFGLNSLKYNTNGQSNLAIGGSALQENRTGSHNIGIGVWALLRANSSFNIGLGNNADQYIENINSERNIAIGMDAITTTNASKTNVVVNSIAIGRESNCNSYSNSVAIGYGATCTAANQFMLGRSSETVVIPGNFSSKNELLKDLGVTKIIYFDSDNGIQEKNLH
jgi:hypothetical protein